MKMERPEIVELFYSALFSPNDVEQFLGFLGPRVEWILAAADPQTLGEELPSNAIKFSGKEGFRQLGLYFRDRLVLENTTGVFKSLTETCNNRTGQAFWKARRDSITPLLHYSTS
jgi:hypothetical protein